MSGASDEERLRRIRKRLARIAERGLEEWWVRQVAGTLLTRMKCVQQRVDGGTTPAQALIEIIREQVAEIGDTPHGSILTIVLAIDEQYLGMPAPERHRVAGLEFHKGQHTVKPATIRKYHLPRALERLARRLLSLEAATQ